MTTVQIPITRAEVREEVEHVLQFYATKEDLSQLEVRLIKAIGDIRADIRGELPKAVIGLAGLQLVGLGAVAAILRFLS